MKGNDYASPLQRTYADTLRVLASVGYGLLVVFYGLYLADIVPPGVPPEVTAQNWHLPADEYVKTTDVRPGSGWLYLLHHGDGLSLASLAFLALVSVPCLMRILPLLIRQRDWIYTILVAAEISVLLLAASGVLEGGH